MTYQRCQTNLYTEAHAADPVAGAAGFSEVSPGHPPHTRAERARFAAMRGGTA
jgi:hypothetical protein